MEEVLLDSKWMVALGIMLMAYCFFFVERVNAAVVALTGALLMVLSGVLTQSEAFAGIDANTISLLLGMMIIVHISEQSGMFQYIAIWSAKKVRANPRGLLAATGLVTALLSAFLDNVTTVLLIVPVTLLLTEKLKVSPYPYLYMAIFSSNIGGTATLIGDPPNIMLGGAKGFSFMDFIYYTTPPSLIIMVLLIFFMDLFSGRCLRATMKDRARVMLFKEKDCITDPFLLWKSLFVLLSVIFGFIIGHNVFHIETGTVALCGAAALLILQYVHLPHEEQSKHVATSLGHGVDWTTIFFFSGLFVIVAGVERSGLLTLLGHALLGFTGNDPLKMTMLIAWGGAFFSTIINNIPFIATMIPLVDAVTPGLGGEEAVFPVWWALALGACLGGNGTVIGATANVMVASMAMRAGYRGITFGKYMVYGLSVVFLSMCVSTVYLYWRFF